MGIEAETDPFAGAVRGAPLPQGMTSAINSVPTPQSMVPKLSNPSQSVLNDPFAGAARIGSFPSAISSSAHEEVLRDIPEATTLWESLKAGAEGTATALTLNQKLPSFRIGENTPFWNARAAAVSGLIVDFPLMFGAGLAGSMTPAGPIGGAVAMGAVPAAIRASWMQALTKGEITDPRDFAQRAGEVIWDTTKAGATMGIMQKTGALLGVNQLVAAGIDKVIAGKIVNGTVDRVAAGFENTLIAQGAVRGAATQEIALAAAYREVGMTAAEAAVAKTLLSSPLNVVKNLGGQIIAGTVAGAALEGRLPNAEEFVDTSIALFGLHYAGAGIGKLRQIYARSNRTPAEVFVDVQERPSILTDIFPTTPEVKTRESAILERILTRETRVRDIEERAAAGDILTPEDIKLRDTPVAVPADASPVLRRAVEVAAKKEETRTPAENHFLEIVKSGEYGSMVRGTASADTVAKETERKIQELETKAAETRMETKVLTEEQQAKMAEAQTKHDQALAFVRGKYKDNEAEMNVRVRDLERQFATEKRQIAGEMTSVEVAKREAEGRALFANKPVLVDGKPAVVIKAGIRDATVRLEDGTQIKVKRDRITSKPVETVDLTVGMTPAQVEEYQFLKDSLRTKDLGGIAQRYGLALSDSVLGGALPKSVAEHPVYNVMKTGIEAALAGRVDVPKDYAEATARVYFAMYDAMAKRMTEGGSPRTVQQLFDQRPMRFSDSLPKGQDSIDPGILGQSARSWNDEAKAKIRAEAAKRGLDPLEVERWITDIDSAKLLVEGNPDLDYVASLLYSPLKANSDPHYVLSLDFSTLCKKRLVMQATIEAIQLEMGRGVTPEEFLKIRDRLKEKGYEVSCGACYVESRRMNMGDIVEKFSAAHPDIPKEKFLTQEGLDWVKQNHPDVFKEWGAALGPQGIKGQESRTEYGNQILDRFTKNPKLVAKFNEQAGLRWQSWSDFEMVHGLDAMQAITDMALVKLKGHAYTKVAEFAELLGNTGMMINLSLIPKGRGLENGQLVFDPVEGMPFEKAVELRGRFNTAGTIAIGVSDAHIREMLNDTRIDYVIPYHHSGLNAERRASMGMPWNDYTAVQFEKVIDRVKNAEFGGREKKGKWETATPEFYDHWDAKLTTAENVKKYLELCDEMGVTPKFPQFKEEPGYWKLLVDRRMFDAEGNPIEQKPVEPNFDQATVERLFSQYKTPEGRSSEGKALPADDVVREFTGRTEPTAEWEAEGGRVLNQSGIQFSMPAPVWYSELTHQIGKLPQTEMTAAEWKALLVKPPETKRVGVRENGVVVREGTPEMQAKHDVIVKEINERLAGDKKAMNLALAEEAKRFNAESPPKTVEQEIAPAKALLAGVKMQEIKETEILEWLDANVYEVRPVGEKSGVVIDAKKKLAEIEAIPEGERTQAQWAEFHLARDIVLKPGKYEETINEKGDMTRMITKEQIQQFLAQGGAKLEFKDKILGNVSAEQIEALADKLQLQRPDADYAELMHEAKNTLERDVAGDTHFSDYELPGGENYREAFVTVPQMWSGKKGWMVKNPDGMGGTWFPTEKEAHAYAKKNGGLPVWEASEKENLRGAGNWKDGHSSYSGIDNPVVRVRFNDRTDADGKKVLFLEELQPPNNPEFGKMPKTLQDRWLAIGIKRMIRYAAENGYDRISWTTGEQQVQRYESALRKQVDSIEWEKTPEGVQLVGWKGTDKRQIDRVESLTQREVIRLARYVDPTGFSRLAVPTAERAQKLITAWATDQALTDADIVRVWNKEVPHGEQRTKVVDTTEKESALSDAIGKAMADRILNDPNQTGVIEGENLTVDSVGVKKLYDVGVPSLANKILKELGGGKVGEIAIPQKLQVAAVYNPPGAREPIRAWQIKDHADRIVAEFATREEAYAAKANMGAKQPSFDITPALRERAMGGMPLYQENRGFYQRSTGTVGFLKGSDPTTTIHEGWHFFFDFMVDMARDPSAPAEIRADVQKMFDHIGIKSLEEWDGLAQSAPNTPEYKKWVDAHEYMARSGEAYVMTGDFPVTGLRSVFSRFKEWLIQTYQTIERLGVTISPEIRGVFDRMIGEDSTALKGEYGELAKRDRGTEIMPGFNAEKVAIQPYPDFAPSKFEKPPPYKLNAWKVNSREDIEAAILRIQEVYPTSETRKSWKEADYEAASELNRILNDGNQADLSVVMEKLGGAGKPVDERFRSLVFVLDEVTKYQVDLREKLLSKWEMGFDVEPREQIEYLQSIERTHMVYQELIGQRAAIGRALNQMRQVGKYAETDFLSKMDVLHQSGAEKEEFVRKQLDDLMSDYRARFGENVTVREIAQMDKKNQTMRDQVKFNEAVLKASNFEKFIEVWKAWGLLSGPVTTVTNVVGTGSFMYMRPIIDMMSAGFGALRGAEVGERQAFIEGVTRLTSMTEGIIGGAKAAVESMKTETPNDRMDVFKGANEGKFGTFARLPFRLMSGGDVWTQFAYKRGELQTLATRQAISEGKVWGTREMGERVAEIMLRPTADMIETMEKQSARMAFNDPDGTMAKALNSATRMVPALNIIFPFKRTPLNVLDEMIRMSPFAPLSKAWREAMAKPGIESDRAKAEFALGVGIFSAVIGFAMSGNITGNGPPDPGKKKTWLADHQPYSVKIGSKWYEYQRLQPVGTLIGMAADMAEIWEHLQKEDSDKAAKMISFAFANAVTNQTFLQGLASFINAMADPDRYGPQYVHSFIASSVVPAFMSQTAAMKDPYAREVYTTLDAIKYRIMGLRETLQPKIDWVGQPVETPGRVLGVMPVRTKTVSEDLVLTEASRLGISVPAAPKKGHVGHLTGKMGDIKFEPEERTKYAEVSGQMAYSILSQIVSSPGWQAMPETTPQEMAIKRNIFMKVLASSHKFGAFMAMPPEKRQAALEQVYQKFTAPIGAQ